VTNAFNSFGFANYDPLKGASDIQAFFNEQDTNLATEVESTIDLQATYAMPTDVGQFTFQGDVVHYMTDTLKTTITAPETQLLDTFGEPLRWKSRDSIMWNYQGFSAGLTINYQNGYANSLLTPAGNISSWTTADLYLGYALGPSDSGSLLENFRVSLTMQNMFDTKPPYVQIPSYDLLTGQNPVSFDPVNGSPIGRFIAVQLTKDF
jgi:iron complex outermembrane receptor protein